MKTEEKISLQIELYAENYWCAIKKYAQCLLMSTAHT